MNFRRIMRVVSLLVICLYIIVGSSLVFTSFYKQLLPEPSRTIIGVVAIVYGLFRAARLYSEKSTTDQE